MEIVNEDFARSRRSVDIHIERSTRTQRSLLSSSNDDYDRVNSDFDDDDEDRSV